MHWQNMHLAFKNKNSRKEASFSVNSINRKTIDLYHLLHGKAVIYILELRKCVRSIRKAKCKQNNATESHNKHSIEK